MKVAILGTIILAIAAHPALAAQPGKTAETRAGTVYVDEKGMTLYTFDNDEPNKSNCYDQCAAKWPPYLAEGNAERSGEWSVVERKDGTRMWAYKNQPLYNYAADKKPGDLKGEGKGGVWHVAVPKPE